MTSSALKIKMSPTEITHIEPQFDAGKLIELTLSKYSVDIRSQIFAQKEEKKEIYEVGYSVEEILSSPGEIRTDDLEKALTNLFGPEEKKEEKPAPTVFDKIFGYDPNRSEDDKKVLASAAALFKNLLKKSLDEGKEDVEIKDTELPSQEEFEEAMAELSKPAVETNANQEVSDSCLHSTAESNRDQPISPISEQLTIQEKADTSGPYFQNLMAKVRNRPAPPTYSTFVSESEKIYTWLHSSDDVGTVETYFVTSNHSSLNNIKQDTSYVFVASGKFDGLGGQFFLRKTSETAGKAPYEN